MRLTPYQGASRPQGTHPFFLSCILETLSWGSSNLGHADHFLGQSCPSKVALVKRGIWTNLGKKGQPRKNRATKPIPDCLDGQCAFQLRAKEVPVGAVRTMEDTSAAETVRPREGHNTSPKHASAQEQSEIRPPLASKRPKEASGRQKTTLQDLFNRSPLHGVAAHRPGKAIHQSSSSSSVAKGSGSDVSHYSARIRLSATPDISSISSFSSSSSLMYPESHSSREIVEAPSSHSSLTKASPSRWLHNPVKPAAEKQNRKVVTTSKKSQWPDHSVRILDRNYVPTPASVWDPHHEAHFIGKGLDQDLYELESMEADRELKNKKIVRELNNKNSVRELKNENTVRELKNKNPFRWLKNVNPVQWLKNKNAVRELKSEKAVLEREKAAQESENAVYESHVQNMREAAKAFERHFRAGHNDLHPGERR